MKKKILGIITLVTLSTCCLFGCNKQVVDFNQRYNRAIIALQNGEVIEIEVAKWNDYDGEQLQIVAKDGTVYLTSSFNCTLIRD